MPVFVVDQFDNSILNSAISSCEWVLQIGKAHVMTGDTSVEYNASLWSVHSGLLRLINGS